MAFGSGSEKGFSNLYLLVLLFVGISLFYLGTLAPTVLWGDSAFCQRAAWDGTLKPDGGGHWLWLQFARLFASLPIGSVALRVNLLSAVAAVVTLIFLYRAMRALELGCTGAVVACTSLTVSHTFWMHAVRAEVYTVFTAIMALQLWLWLSWRPEKPWPMYLAGCLLSISFLGHQMAVLLVPAALFLLAKRRRWFSTKDWAVFFGLFTIGLLFFVVVLFWQTKDDNLFNTMRLYFTRADVYYTQSLFDFSLLRLPRDLVIWLGLLGLQFVGCAGLLGIYGLGKSMLRVNSWVTLLILYATGVFFAFSYRVNDQFVFYLPSYVTFSFFVARGWQRVQSHRLLKSYAARIGVLVSIVLLPIALYSALPRLLTLFRLNPLDVRTLPGREPNQYFLWPASSDDYGAAIYAQTALQGVAPNSAIIADHTPLEPLRYLQTVEGVRPDVQLIKIEPGEDLRLILSDLPSGQVVYIADNNPDYYNLKLLGRACAVPFRNIYRLLVGESSEQCE